MINIISQPPSIPNFTDDAAPPVPLSDCIQFCLQPDVADVFTVVGSKAKVVITLGASVTVVADGTTFKVWGHAFTVDSSQAFTSTSFKADSFGIITILNISSMFNANIFFNRAVSIDFQIVSGSFVLTLEWQECREQINFTGANMDLAVFTSLGGSGVATQGVSPELVESYRMVVRTIRWTDATNQFKSLSQLSGLEVEKLCDEVGINCIQLNADISPDLYTLLPAMTDNSFISTINNGRSMMRYYGLQYGWTYRENCVAKSGTIVNSNRVLVLNAAFDIDDPYQMRRYWYGHPDGLAPEQSVVDYLTTQPKELTLCESSFKWLWFLNNWKDEYGAYALVARFTLYDANGEFIETKRVKINDPTSQGSSNYQAVCFNVSPSYIVNYLSPTSAFSSYEVQVVGTEVLNINTVLFNATEYLKFNVTHCCEDTADLYFLSPAGGIDTINVKVQKEEVLQSDGEEVRVQIGCGTSREDKAANGGRSLVSMRVYKKLTLVVELNQRSDAWAKWMKHLRQSPQRWIRVKDEGGNWLAKKIVFEPGAFKVKQSGIGESLEIVGYLQDIPTQDGTEKFIL